MLCWFKQQRKVLLGVGHMNYFLRSAWNFWKCKFQDSNLNSRDDMIWFPKSGISDLVSVSLCVWMCVLCVCVCVCVCPYVSMCVSVCVICVCVPLYVCQCTSVCVSVCIYVGGSMCLCMYLCGVCVSSCCFEESCSKLGSSAVSWQYGNGEGLTA